MEHDERMTGTVKFFNEIKGYGFIVPDGGGNDVFVHISAVHRSGLTQLDNGIRVSYATEPDKRGKGPKAIEIRVEP
jgi:CspA family cold shock protein